MPLKTIGIFNKLDCLLPCSCAANPAIKLVFQGASADDELFIEIHKVRWEAPTNNVSGRDQSSMSLSFVALVDAALAMSNVSLKIDNQGSAGRYSTL